ncbi:MAG: D-cysteine desulfhydrase [Deinococcales bacterium]
MHLARFPRQSYTPHPTAIETLPHLSKFLGGPKLFIKRDDLLGLTAGGNKTRKLEFLVADALAQGADTLITVGAVQSNHCRLTLAAAVKEGLKCQLLLEERVPNSYKADASGNNFLFKLLGVEVIKVVPLGTDLMATMQDMADKLAQEGRKAYIIPCGGSNALGALGYVNCAEEMLRQSFEMGLRLDHIVLASGSGGTHAGMLAGLIGNNAHIPITGISVRQPKAKQEAHILNLAQQVANLLDLREGIPTTESRVLDDYVGEGYSLPTTGMIEAVKLLASLEGILLDPVYTGKAMAGLIDLVRKGHFKRDDQVLFLHTGGAPALYAYQDVLSRE